MVIFLYDNLFFIPNKQKKNNIQKNKSNNVSKNWFRMELFVTKKNRRAMTISMIFSIVTNKMVIVFYFFPITLMLQREY